MKKILQVYEMFTSYDGTTFVYALSYSLLLALAPLTALLVVFFRRSPRVWQVFLICPNSISRRIC